MIMLTKVPTRKYLCENSVKCSESLAVSSVNVSHVYLHDHIGKNILIAVVFGLFFR